MTPQALERDHADALIAHVTEPGPMAAIQRLRYWWLFVYKQPDPRHLDTLLGYLVRWGRLVRLSPVLYAPPAPKAAEPAPAPTTRARATPAPPTVGQRILATLRRSPTDTAGLHKRLPDVNTNTLRGRVSELAKREAIVFMGGAWRCYP